MLVVQTRFPRSKKKRIRKKWRKKYSLYPLIQLGRTSGFTSLPIIFGVDPAARGGDYTISPQVITNFLKAKRQIEKAASDIGAAMAEGFRQGQYRAFSVGQKED